MAQNFNCPACGAPLEPEGDKASIVCKYCNESVLVPEGFREHPHKARKAAAHSVQPVKAFDSTGFFQNYLKTRLTITIISVVVVVIFSCVMMFVVGFLPMAVGLMAMVPSMFQH